MADPTFGSTTRVSIANNGIQGNNSSNNSVISADGRFVAYDSLASNLVAGDTNKNRDVFVRDLKTNTTTRVSVASDGTEGNKSSSNPSISGDGRFVAFLSTADNLVVANDTNTTTTNASTQVTDNSLASTSPALDASTTGNSANVNFDLNTYLFVFPPYIPIGTNIFLHDIQKGTTIEASVAADGTEGNGGSSNPAISTDGHFLAFQSDANNLVPDDTNNSTDVFIRDLLTNTINRISVANDGTEGNSNSSNPAISADGRFVAFQSTATNLVGDDINNTTGNVRLPSNSEIFVRDLLTDTTTEVSVASDGTEGNSISSTPAISADGRFVAFQSAANNLVPNDTNKVSDIFVRDLLTGTTNLVSVADDGTEGNKSSSNPAISADGRFVAFQSTATNLVGDNINNTTGIVTTPSNVSQTFVRDLLTGTTTQVSLTDNGIQGNSSSSNPVISADGSVVAFQSSANNLVLRDTNNSSDIFVHVTNNRTNSNDSLGTVALGANTNDISPNDVLSAMGVDTQATLSGSDTTTLHQSNFTTV